LDTKRQNIVNALETLFSSVSALKAVTVWQHLPELVGDLPAGTFRDQNAAAKQVAGGITEHTLEVAFDFSAAGDTPTDSIRSIAGDVLAAFSGDRLLGGLLTAASMTGFDLGFESANLKLCIGSLKFQLTYETDNWTI